MSKYSHIEDDWVREALEEYKQKKITLIDVLARLIVIICVGAMGLSLIAEILFWISYLN